MNSALAAGIDRVRRATSAGVPHLMLASAATSGIAYLQQLAIARFVSPDQFAIVRSVEAAMVVLLLIASYGMPTLAVRLLAEVVEGQRAALLRLLLRIVMITSVLVAVGVSVWTTVVPESAVTLSLRVLVWSILFTVPARVIYGYHQGVLQVHAASLLATLLAACAFVLLAVLVATLGLRGWLVGRLVGEALVFAGMLWLVRVPLRSELTSVASFTAPAIMSLGTMITISLALRGALDSVTILLLGGSSVPAEDVGYFGLGTLAVTALMLLPGSISAALLPRMVSQHARQEKRLFLRDGVMWAFGLTLALTLVGVLLLPFLLQLLLPAYVGGAHIIAVVLWAAPCRAVTTIAGSQLLAISRMREPIVVNALGVGALAVMTLAVAPEFGAFGVAWGAVGIEAAMAVAMIALASSLRGPPPARPTASAPEIAVL